MKSINLTVVLAALIFSKSYAILTPVTDWGENPTNLDMALYVPPQVAENPAIVLALHYCGGTGLAYYLLANYDKYADAKGFIVIYPTTHKDTNCWDVASEASLSHDGAGDSGGLVNMVKYVTEKYNADPTKVFATGSSSGCMMTNVLLAAYPDVFAAGSCYSGVAATCLQGSPGSSPISADPTCASGQNVHTGEEWAERVRAMYPEYNGTYPRMQTFHGTADTFVNYPNLAEQLKEWSALLDVEFSKNITDTPQTGYTQMIYGDGTKLVGYSALGVGHTVPVHPDLDMAWFGLD
ncbi:PHB depolymerase family esterase [Biscogniauxia mediterranea]|nr:PHB depolymerase family esterase [Biscogniauxia mediterranea]